MARCFDQQEVLSQFINIYKPGYVAFINLAVAFDAPTHQDIYDICGDAQKIIIIRHRIQIHNSLISLASVTAREMSLAASCALPQLATEC